MRRSQDQKYRIREKIRCECFRKARLGVEILNKSEMERRLSEIVSAETLTKCIYFRALRALPAFGRLPLLWETAPALGGVAFAFSQYSHPIAEARTWN